STTATLAFGDALAVALLDSRAFTAEDFARSHPGGSLGRRLLLRVEDVMHREADIPAVGADSQLSDALLEMSAKGLGMTTVIDADGGLAGIFTDGDLRRLFASNVDVRSVAIADVMTTPCRSIHQEALAAEAVRVLEEHAISALPVTDQHNKVVGALNVHDLLRAGVM
ncbi:MAG: CBS domain-containing protein, partial [Pseudomonadota bacterium]